MTATVAGRLPRTGALPLRIRRDRLGLAVLLVGTAVLYLWDLGASGYSNDYYAAAVQAMTHSWKAFLFGSFDAGNILTVDKPPASLWLMALSTRIFGFSSWTMLVPIALTGVATVALLHAAVRRVCGPHAALLAGTVMALTPVAALMFRVNNPDALVTLLVVAAAYAAVRATETASTRWLLLAGVFVGLGFLTKMGQALLVVPALALAYLVAAPTGLPRRLWQLVASGIAMVVGAGWWVAIVAIWPAADRPYISGSTTNSVLQLALGYNGLGRIFGDKAHGTSGGERGGGFASTPGLGRMFSNDVGAQVSWLLPAALALLVIALWLTRRAPRTDPVRASLLLWGGWTLVTALVFSMAAGDFHSYYTVTLAPGVAGLVGIGGYELWQRRVTRRGRVALALIVAVTAVWAVVLLHRSAHFLPWLRWVVAVAAVLAVVALLSGPTGRRWGTVTATLVVITALVAPAAYAVDTVATPHTGGKPSAGPPAGKAGTGDHHSHKDHRLSEPAGDAALATPALGLDPAVVTVLRKAGTKWSAATVGGRDAAVPALASGTTVMCIGGFSGRDPAPTLDQFRGYVAARQVHYFILPDSSRSHRSAITTWVQGNYPPSLIGGQTLYDLTRAPQPQPRPLS